MIYFLSIILLILSGLTFALTAPIYDIAGSDAWLGCAMAFGLIASSLPILKARRTLKDVMIAIALIAFYTAGIASVRDSYLRGYDKSNPLHIRLLYFH
ncbi:hypothetical protein P12x_002330 [Tundrisphaera lichenicola]|uniref:hypothetical protein n=1 Tax=Tundrisphaera lichenicola TaxID=2029860 RepID=UPI003EC0FD9A